MIRLSCSFDTPLGRHYEEDYIRALRIDVVGADEDLADVIVGKIGMDQAFWADAVYDRQPLSTSATAIHRAGATFIGF